MSDNTPTFEPAWLTRVRIELSELNIKIDKLASYLLSTPDPEIVDMHRRLLHVQLAAMDLYAKTLRERITLWSDSQ
jgi:hypothetical protein